MASLVGGLKKIALLPVHAAAVGTAIKSFKGNPILGNPRLNRMGLHVKRVRLAEKMSIRRQAGLARLINHEQAELINRDGYIVIKNVLPDDVFAKLSNEVENTEFLAREMRQGGTVTRLIPLPPAKLASLEHLNGFVNGDLFQGLLRYTASFNHESLVNLHTVITDPSKGDTDPQTMFHSDTFHATAKGWFFLRDVEMADGPFGYVPGSHRMTKGRLDWEYEQSLIAAKHENGHHALGSFRASNSDLKAMGYGDIEPLPVPANSLVIADTHGFHARCESSRPSTRLSIYGSLRCNPFVPVSSLDVFRLPGLRGRKGDAVYMGRAALAKLTQKAETQPVVGMVRPGDPAVL